jgi:hypothetical protein
VCRKATPSGKLVTVDLATKAVVAECDIGGQPDSVARAKDGSFLAIAVENERDEEVNDGALAADASGLCGEAADQGRRWWTAPGCRRSR